MFNAEQRDYMRSLAEMPPEKTCYCGWYPLGSCPHCEREKTGADKLQDWLAKPCVCPKYCEHCRAKEVLAYWEKKGQK